MELEMNLQGNSVSVWIGFIRLRIGPNAGFLWTC